jgi:hypothetical protein
MLQALKLKYEGQIAMAEAAIKILLQQSVAVGEHPTDKLFEDLDHQLQVIADCRDKLEVLNSQ